MLTLFPPIKPYAVHQLETEDIHTLYVEESGNPQGMPVVFLHGGPGGGTNPDHRRFFDPTYYRIILFDQRGCGNSTPHAELRQNSTPLLISDLEMIRTTLRIDKWTVFGGSWGSTLALLYAQAHPERVRFLILRGIFLCRDIDLAWFYEVGGAGRLFPDYWQAFVEHLPIEERGDILENYYKRLIGHDEIARMAAAKAWSIWEGSCSTLQGNSQLVEQFSSPHTALSLARIEAHYFINNCFIEPDQIIKNINKIADIPGIIVHGRYDVVCPVDNAYALHAVWPNSELQIVRDAGHAASEPGITHALITATNRLVTKTRS